MKVMILVFLLALSLSSSQAALCLENPLRNGDLSYCGDTAPCTLNNYCDKTNTCVPKKENDQPCEDDNECKDASSCVGPENAMVCKANVGVGETCSEDRDVAQSVCGPALFCSNSTCLGGSFGDGCSNNDQCNTGLCTAGVCTYQAAGGPCSPGPCRPEEYCPEDTCVPRLQPGSPCDFGSECASGICSRLTPEANRTCIASASIAAGEYCGNVDSACVSGHCYDSYCLGQSPSYCDSNDDCVPEELCLCNGRLLDFYGFTGYGTCGKISCFDDIKAILDCGVENCEGRFYIDYPNSCFNLNCASLTLSDNCAQWAPYVFDRLL